MIRLQGRLISLPAWLLVLLAALVVRFALSPLPGYDVRDYRLWAELAAQGGAMAIYHADIFIPYNYPPAFIYILDAVGRFYALFPPSFDPTGVFFGVLLKTPAILADAFAALAIYGFLRTTVSLRSAVLGGLAYALNPALIWNTAYWGGIDAIHSVLAFLAILLLIRGLPEVSWLLLALSVLTKPLSIPIVIIAAFLTVLRFGLRRAALCGAVAALSTLAATAPFLIAGTFGEMVSALWDNVGNYDNLSANAHNFWWLVSGGYGWTKDTNLFLGVASYRAIGTALFVLFALWCLYSLQRTPQAAHILFVCALLAFAFFMLPTEVHENWSFGVFPFLVAASFLEPRFRPVLVALSVTFWLNLALHDLYFGYRLPQGLLGSFLASARMANSVANNIILAYAAVSFLGAYRAPVLARRRFLHWMEARARRLRLIIFRA